MDPIDALIRTQALPQAYRPMVDVVHRPASDRIVKRHKELGRPIVVGLSGGQGSGKSTMAAFLKLLLEGRGLKVAVLSLDDLYLTPPERERLAREAHPLLATRGVPGTHDAGLGMALIDILTNGPAVVSMPVFDKAEDSRIPAGQWPQVRAPVDVVLFEGWCVGARPQPDAELAEPVNALERDEDRDGVWRRYVNDQLKGDYAQLFSRIDFLAMLQAPCFEAVRDWRALQEQKLADRIRREGRPGRMVMDAAAIGRFLMFYERITRSLLEEMPARADILMPMDEAHRILRVEFKG